MISIAEAKQLCLQEALPSKTISLSLSEAAGRVLAQDLTCPLDLPPFRSTSMDGYALRLSDQGGNAFKVVGETPAGAEPGPALSPGEARRIFTGAALPPETTVVAMQEMAQRDGDLVTIEEAALQPGRYIREIGSAIKEGEPALSKGTVLGPGALGLIASMGMATAKVFQSPSVALLGSGDELVKPGMPLRTGQIYESNSYALESAVAAMRPGAVSSTWLPDDEALLRSAVAEALAQNDLLVLCGGISVGEYDFVGRVLRDLEVETVFYKVMQRPGKPLFFGKAGEKRVFGLPGNPASALVCFYEYVYPMIRRAQGFEETELRSVLAELQHPIEKKFPRPSFERAHCVQEDGAFKVQTLAGQESYQMKALALANSLVFLPEGEASFPEGSKVEVHLLP